jgi:predicted SAM-dependent methyltransferase
MNSSKYKQAVSNIQISWWYKILEKCYSLFWYWFDSKLLYYTIKKFWLKKQLKNIDKLNIGCGDNLIKGWLNIKLTRYNYGFIKIKNEVKILNFDMRFKLPLASNQIRYIYASHFIEHLTFEEGNSLLKECYTNMKKGGIIRLTCPDMELWIKKYHQNNKSFFKKYHKLALKDKKDIIKTKGEILMSQVHGFGHKWNYDFESLKHVLEDAGFKNVTRKKVFESSIPEIKQIEPCTKLRLLETLYVEAKK